MHLSGVYYFAVYRCRGLCYISECILTTWAAIHTWSKRSAESGLSLIHSISQYIANYLPSLLAGNVSHWNQRSSAVLSNILQSINHVLVLQTAKSIEEALQAFVCKEYIDGYTCPTTKQQLDAHRKLTFDQLPTILILHLKCFVYDKHGGSQKVHHTMEFKENLVFEKGTVAFVVLTDFSRSLIFMLLNSGNFYLYNNIFQ